MGTFITQQDTPVLFPDGPKSPAPGARLRPDWTYDNVLRSSEANALHDGLMDVRSALRDGTAPVLAAGSTTLRTLTERFADAVNVKDFGANGDAVTDDTATINAAVAAALARGVRLVWFPPGIYKITDALNTYSGMSFLGAGMDATTLRCVSSGSFRCFSDAEGSTQASPMTGVKWADMTIDGSFVQGVSSKAFFVQHMRRCQWDRVRVTAWPATGFGADYLQDCVFSACIADGNGRLLSVGDPGASGFGIGTGAYATESVTLIGCRAYGNKNYGIFFEQQADANGGSPYLSNGARVIGCHCTGNNWGIGDSGCDGLIVSGCTLEDNTQDGFAVDQGTGGGIGRPGRAGRITGCITRGNGRYGVFLDYRFKAGLTTDSGYAVFGNRIEGNGVHGVQLSVDTFTISDVSVLDNEVVGNGAVGVAVSVLSSGSWRDLRVDGNRINRNGQTNLGGFTQGIRIDGSTLRLSVRRNKCYDSGTVQKQSHGLKISSAGTHTDALIEGNDLRGNLTGSMDLTGGPTFAGLTVNRNNRGWNPRGEVTAPATPSSGGNYTNITGYDCTVYISVNSGGITAVQIGGPGVTPTATGLTVPSSASPPVAVRVPAGGTIAVIYTGSFSWKWFAD